MHAMVLDAERLHTLRGLDDDGTFVDSLIDDFIDDAEHIIAAMETAADAGEAREFRDQAHAFRSSAAHIGAKAIFDLCLTWRGITPAELDARGRAHMTRVRREFALLKSALRAEQRSPTAAIEGSHQVH